MICMKKLQFSSRPRAKVRRQGPLGSARKQPCKSINELFIQKRIPLTKKISYKIINKMFIHIRAVGLSMLVCLVRPCSMFWYFIPPSSHVSTVNTAVFCFFWHSIGLNTLIPLVQPCSIFISMHAWLFVALTQSTA